MLGKPVPIIIDIAPTYRCQCNCVHCSIKAYSADRQSELDTSQIKSIIDEAWQLGVLEMIFSGGEPLLREDIVELVRHANTRGMITRLNTNGLLLNRERVSELKQAGLSQCGVSIDDADPEIHDKLRGVKGAYEKALAGMKNLREFGIFFQILTYASKQNIPSGLEKIISLGRDLGALAVYIFLPTAAGRWIVAFNQVLTETERAKVRELQDLTFVRLELPTASTMCPALDQLFFYVTAQGDVTPCPFAPFVIGNIRDHKLDDLWYRYSTALNVVCRGDCPVNDVCNRETLKRQIQSIAISLR